MAGGMYIGIAAAAVLVGLVAYFFALFPRHVSARLNRAPARRRAHVSDQALELHGKLFVADLHCDALMWNRDIVKRGSHGHVDLPRLREGNVSLQVFSAVTQIPLVPRHTGNTGRGDMMTPLVVAGRWPVRSWTSPAQRALYQARKLHEAAARSQGRLTMVRTAGDLDRFIASRDGPTGSVAGLLLLEGLHALEGDIGNVGRFFDAGFRVMGLVHLFDNEVGGSMHGVDRGGLTGFGRRVLRRMDELGMIVDLAHASSRLVADVLEATSRPVLVTHTGVKGTCDTARNLSDDDVRLIAGAGGVIGIGFWRTAVCGDDTASIVRAIRYTADLVGVEHVALGSDFDGAVRTPFDASGLVRVTQALLDAGFHTDEVAAVMGRNALSIIQLTLPQTSG